MPIGGAVVHSVTKENPNPVAIYRYTDASLLNEVQILTNETGGKRAYMHARDSGSSDQLRAAKQELRARGFQCVPTVRDGKPMLEVRGFEKNEDFIGAITQAGLVTGAPNITPDAGDKRTLTQKAKNSTLQLAGYSYNIGDAFYMWYATAPVLNEWKEASKEKRFFGVVGIVAGLGYALGSLCLTFFGAKDQSINIIKSSTSKIERFARKEGYNVPTESSIAYVNAEPPRGFFGNVKATLARYPSEALNVIYTGVGTCIAAASFYKGTRPIGHLVGEELIKARKSNRNELIDVGLGAVTATSALIGIGVKETKRLDGDPKRTGFAGIIDWIKEKPLRATGVGYGIATGWHAISTYNHWKDGTEPKKYLYGRAIFIGANIFSEVMLAISSKGHGNGVKPDGSVDDSVMAATAELVLRQPIEKREAVIQQLAGYMASPEVLATKADVIEAELRKHIDLLDNNPWTSHFTGHEGSTQPMEHLQLPQKKMNVPEVTPVPGADLSQSARKDSGGDRPTNTISHAQYNAKHQPLDHVLA